MTTHGLGFIGGGRVTRIILGGLEKAGRRPRGCVVSEPDQRVAAGLIRLFPDLIVSGADCAPPAAQDIVFGALHPPVLRDMLPELGPRLRPDSIFVSLAPKLTLDQLVRGLGEFQRVVRMIPNAPSIVGHGFNPVSFRPALTHDERRELLHLLEALGECPVVEEGLLEAYAIITGMGPTYLWFQLRVLEELGCSFGLTADQARVALSEMCGGASQVWFESHLSPAEALDMIPVHPLREDEPVIAGIYQNRLRSLYAKLRPSIASEAAFKNVIKEDIS